MHQWMVQGFDGACVEMMDKEKPQVTEEMLRETDRFWDDPEKIMMLIDILFLWENPDKEKVVS